MNADEASEDLLAFIGRLSARFASMEDAQRPPLVLVAAASDQGRAILIYRERPDGPLLGRVYDVDVYASLFQPPQTAEALADIAFTDDFLDPTGHGEFRDVDWAVGLVDNPHEVEWVIGAMTTNPPS